jgi:hypothetical protein
MKDVDLRDVGSWRQRILVGAKANRVGEVGAQLTYELENAAIIGIPSDGQGSLQRSICDIAGSVAKGSWVCLCQERCNLSGRRRSG